MHDQLATVEVPLLVRGIDLMDEATLDVIAERLTEFAWRSVDGKVTATLFVPDNADLVCDAVSAARRIAAALPTAEVDAVYRELVSTTDIAERVGVSRETVRTWSEKLRAVDDFPLPEGTVGGGKRGAMKVWLWTDVLEWLWRARRIDLGERLPDRHQMAKIDAYLQRIPSAADEAWETEHATPTTGYWRNVALQNRAAIFHVFTAGSTGFATFDFVGHLLQSRWPDVLDEEAAGEPAVDPNWQPAE